MGGDSCNAGQIQQPDARDETAGARSLQQSPSRAPGCWLSATLIAKSAMGPMHAGKSTVKNLARPCAILGCRLGALMLASVLTDWVIALGTVLGALATFLAVIVALFGPQWRERRRRPLLSIDAQQGSIPWSDPQGAWFTRLTISNGAGRAMAHDVEVTVTVRQAFPNDRGSIFQVNDGPLSFSFPQPHVPLQSRTQIAAGHHRVAYFLGVGHKTGETGLAAALNAVDGPRDPARRAWSLVASIAGGSLTWIDPNQSHDVTVVVTGSNFDAIRFDGQCGLTERPVASGLPDGIWLSWTQKLSLSR